MAAPAPSRQSNLVHGPGGTLVGKDSFNNAYYERLTVQYGRHRWVIYGDLEQWTGCDPTTVPPEWHGWLHNINDDPPTKVVYKKPIYAIAHTPNKTGTADTYQPKGAWKNPEQRNWRKVQIWDANKA